MDNNYKYTLLDGEIFTTLICKKLLDEARPISCFSDQNLDKNVRERNLCDFRGEVKRVLLKEHDLYQKLNIIYSDNKLDIVDIILIKFMLLHNEICEMRWNVFDDQRSICFGFANL